MALFGAVKKPSTLPGRVALTSVAAATCLLAAEGTAKAVDLPKVGGKPLKLDVTETSIVAQRFDAREDLLPRDHGWGQWLNKLNLQLVWDKVTVGTRLDSGVYWLRPVDREFCPTCQFKPGDEQGAETDGAGRFQNSLYVAKLWATYKTKGVEVTAGDAYAQFGRGLALSLRKVDELGIDTTVRGAKIVLHSDPFAATLLAGFANPNRLDEATGMALFPTRAVASDKRGALPVYGSDRILGAQIKAGLGLPVTLSTHIVRFSRCAPFAYAQNGTIDPSFASSPFGSCEESDRTAWLATLPNTGSPLMRARNVDIAGQTFEVPNLWGHGSLYVEAAMQRRHVDEEPKGTDPEGNALYGSFVTNFGPITNNLEIKSYRNYWAVPASVDTSKSPAFSNVQYSQLPTTEILIQDSMFGNMNACVNGGRNRTDVRLAEGLLVFGAFGYYHSKSEAIGGGCDRYGRSQSAFTTDKTETIVWDALSGIEWRFNKDRSQVLLSAGARNDRRDNGDPFYNERSINYSVSVYLSGPFSFELNGRHRLRYQSEENIREGAERGWAQGFHNTAFKIAPKWVFSQGVEYTSLLGFPLLYFNGSMLYRFSSESNLRILVGQQQGGLRCISGVCRIFPAFEGARAELTLRF